MKVKNTLFLIFILNFPLILWAESLEVVTEDLYPFTYMENNEIKGLATDTVIKVIENAGYKYTLAIYPWSRAYNIAIHRKNVLIYTIVKTPFREKHFKWIRPLSKSDDRYIVALYKLRKNDSVNPKSLEEAKAFSVVAYRDSVVHQWLKAHQFKKIHIVNRRVHSLPMLIDERVDMVALDTREIMEDLRYYSYGLDRLDQLFVLFNSSSYMALSLSTSDEILLRLQSSYDDLLRKKMIHPF